MVRLSLSFPEQLLALQRAKGIKGKGHDEHTVRTLLKQWGNDGPARAGSFEVDGTVDVADVFQRFANPSEAMDATATMGGEDDGPSYSLPATACDLGPMLRALSAPHDAYAVGWLWTRWSFLPTNASPTRA